MPYEPFLSHPRSDRVTNVEHDATAVAKRVTLTSADGSGDGINVTSENQVPIVKGFDIPLYDYIALTYVAAGNGAGEIETVTYKTGGAGGTTVATLTLGYDANDKLSTVTQS